MIAAAAQAAAMAGITEGVAVTAAVGGPPPGASGRHRNGTWAAIDGDNGLALQ